MKSIELLLNKMSIYSDAYAIIHSGIMSSYIDLVNSIKQDYNSLVNLGISPGDKVILLSDYSLQSISIFFALVLNKNIVIPITSTNDTEIDERMTVSNPEWIINLREGRNFSKRDALNQEDHLLVQRIIDTKSSGLILFSSGSTGKPKAMIHNLDLLIDSFLDKKSKKIKFLVFLMFDHIGGLNTLLNCLSMGASIVIPENRRPDHIIQLIANHKVNILPATPTFLNLTLISKSFEKYDTSSLIMVTYGTEPMPEALLSKLKQALPRVKFLQTFGTSETGIARTSSKSSSSTYLKFDDPNQEYKIVDNELWLRSKTQILGYINHTNDSFTDDGWFKTGDLVHQTEDGFLKIIGRSKEVINIGGEKVMPTEVESVILELPQVTDCRVFGQSNAITGQIVVAEILLNDNSDHKIEKITIRNHCRAQLDQYKVPSKIIFVDKMNITDRFKKSRT